MSTNTEVRDRAARDADRYVDLSSDVSILQSPTGESRDTALHRAAEIQRKWAGKYIPDAEWQQLRGYLDLAEKLDRQLQMLRSAEASFEKFISDSYAVAEGRADYLGRDQHGNVKVNRETGIYGPGSQHSFYRDLVAANVPEAATDPNQSKEAQQRLSRYGHEQRIDNPEAAKRADLHTAHRATSSESRAMTSASSSGGTFVTPIYDVGDYSVFRQYPASVVEQCTKVEDPGYGLELNIPVWTLAADTAAQVAETAGIDDESLTGDYVTAVFETIAGEVPLSQQLYDRAGPDPVTQDKAISAALYDDLYSTVDEYVIAVMQAAGGITTGQTSFTAADFFQDVANAQAAVATGAGQKLPATHAFAQPAQLQWLLSQSDPNGRPLTLPWMPNTPTAVRPSPSGGAALGFSGYTLLGSALFSDGNIPDVAGSNPVQAPIILANASEVFVLRSEPCLRVVVETFAPSLSIVVQLYQYCAAVVRHATAVQSLQADYLLASPSFS